MSRNSQKVLPWRSNPGNYQLPGTYFCGGRIITGLREHSEINIPTRKRLRHGSFKVFHLYQALRMGLIGFGGITKFR